MSDKSIDSDKIHTNEFGEQFTYITDCQNCFSVLRTNTTIGY